MTRKVADNFKAFEPTDTDKLYFWKMLEFWNI